MIRKVAEYTLGIILTMIVISLIFSYLIGQPALLTFVETGSMEPTLNAGDGFIAIPAAIAGDVGVGTVVVFQSEHVHGGDLTTHRIVDERAGGYVTQGDNNPFTDQSRGEPPVSDGQIKAVALQLNGEVVRIPHLGTGVQAANTGMSRVESNVASLFGYRTLGSEQLAILLFSFGIIFYGLSFLWNGDANRKRATLRTRDTNRAGVFSTTTIIAVFTLILVLATTLAMVMPAGPTTIGIVSADSDPDRPDVIQAGGSSELNLSLYNGGFIPTKSYIEPASDGVEVDQSEITVSRNESANVTLTLHAPPELGYYQRSVQEYRYLLLLPESVLDTAYHIHPWLPYVLINGLVGSVVIIIGGVLSLGSSGTVRLRTRTRSGRSTVWSRIG